MSSQDVDFTRRQVRWRLDVFCVLHAYLKVLVECSSILVIPHWLVTCTYPKVLPELACRTSSFFRFASAVTSILRFTWRKRKKKEQNHPQNFPPHRPLFSINFLSFFHDLTSSPQSDSRPPYTTTTTSTTTANPQRKLHSSLATTTTQ